MTVDIDTVLDAIIEGHLDGELVSLWQAIQVRNEERHYSMTWGIKVPHPVTPGVELSAAEHDLTIREWSIAEELSGRTWATLQPRLSSKCMRAIVAAVIEVRAGLDRAAATAAVDAMSGNDLLDAIVDVEVPRRPLSGRR